MSMMHSMLFVLLFLVGVIVVIGGIFLAVRIYGAREVSDDHPQ